MSEPIHLFVINYNKTPPALDIYWSKWAGCNCLIDVACDKIESKLNSLEAYDLVEKPYNNSVGEIIIDFMQRITWVWSSEIKSEWDYWKPKPRLPITFEQAWKKKEEAGYQYGKDALEQVKFGWEIALEALTPKEPNDDMIQLQNNERVPRLWVFRLVKTKKQLRDILINAKLLT